MNQALYAHMNNKRKMKKKAPNVESIYLKNGCSFDFVLMSKCSPTFSYKE
jgi:hypothetical protein